MYRATFRDNAGLYALFGLLAVLMLFVGIRRTKPRLAGSVFASFLFCLLIRWRPYVICGSEALEARGLFQCRKVDWDAICEVKRLADSGYWQSRFYGPFSYEFRSAQHAVRINFRFFSRDCFREVMDHIST